MADYTVVTQTGLNLQQALLNLWQAFLNVIPGLIAAIIIILIGWIIGKVIKHIVVRILQGAKLDQWLEDHDLEGAIGGKSLSELLGSLTKWYIVILFLAQAAALINLMVLQNFAYLLISWIPALIGAVLVIVASLYIGKYVANRIKETKHKYSKTLGMVIEFLVAYFGVVIGLQTVGFDVTILLDAFRIGFATAVVVLAIILGLFIALSFKKDIAGMAAEMKKGIGK